MSPDFEWQTEEDRSWRAPAGSAAGRRSWPGRPLFLLGVVALALLGGGLALALQLRQRVQEATADTEAQVLASYHLVVQAAEEQDVELFRHFLSGRDPAWSEAQAALLEEGALFDRAAFGLHWRPARAADPAKVSISLSPDLTEAEVVAEQMFAVAIGNGLTATLPLQRTSLFRLGEDAWLYAPPQNAHSYWGGQGVHEGRLLRLAYPLRDEEVVRRLAPDLEKKLAQMCALPDLGCPAGWHLDVRLATEAGVLAASPNPQASRGRLREVSLPAPTLLGLPLNEAGYQALYRAYGSALVKVAVANLVDYECCAHYLFYQALRDDQLAQLGLRPWPLAPADYVQIRDGLRSLEELAVLWHETEAAGKGELNQVYAFVEFLRTDASLGWPPAARLQRGLNTALRFSEWLQPFAAVSLEERWPGFAAEQARRASLPVDG